jgi:hypothetical protein
MIDATVREPTAQSAGCRPVTRRRKVTDKRGHVHEIGVTVYGWKSMALSEAATRLPLAVTVMPIHEPEGLSRRALVIQARTNLAGWARLYKGVLDRGVGWD